VHVWYIVLTPLAVLPALWLLMFVGCSYTATGTGPSPRLQLNLDPNLSTGVDPAAGHPTKVTVQWSLISSGSVKKAVPSPAAVITSTSPGRSVIDPARDPGALYDPKPLELVGIDHVSCHCDIQYQLADKSAPLASIDSAQVALAPSPENNVFVLRQGPDGVFAVYPQTADGS